MGITEIKQIVCTVTSINGDELCSASKEKSVIWARLLFTWHSYNQFGNMHIISRELNKSIRQIYNNLQKYEDELCTNRTFKKLDEQVKTHIDGHQSND